MDFATSSVVSIIKSIVTGKSTGINTHDKDTIFKLGISIDLCFTQESLSALLVSFTCYEETQSYPYCLSRDGNRSYSYYI